MSEQVSSPLERVQPPGYIPHRVGGYFVKNEHGVDVVKLGYGQGEGVFPRVCVDCPLLDSDGDSDGYWTVYFCTRNVIPPTRKGTCKTRETAVL